MTSIHGPLKVRWYVTCSVEQYEKQVFSLTTLKSDIENAHNTVKKKKKTNVTKWKKVRSKNVLLE